MFLVKYLNEDLREAKNLQKYIFGWNGTAPETLDWVSKADRSYLYKRSFLHFLTCMELEFVCGSGGGSSLSAVASCLRAKSLLLRFSPILDLDPGAARATTLRFAASADTVSPTVNLEIDEGMELKTGTATPTIAGDGTLFASILVGRVSFGTKGLSAAGGIGLKGGIVDAPIKDWACKLATPGGFSAWDGALEPNPGCKEFALECNVRVYPTFRAVRLYFESNT